MTESTWTQARAAAALVAARLPAETVAIDALDGRVLADECIALCDLPSFDSSAMDGWAVSGSGPWQIVGDVRAGFPLAGSLQPGQAVRIATGSVVPTGVSGILRWEDASVHGEDVHGSVLDGADIRRAGEEVRTNDIIAAAGTAVTPALAGFLAATGHDEISVVRRPRVHLLLLGDELLSEGVPIHGRVRDSLGPQLPGWLTRMGAQVVAHTQVPDDLPAVSRAFTDAALDADLIITTGGTAAGPRDHVHAALRENSGTLLVDKVSVRPGHPMLLATLAKSVPLVALPGNPHSAIVGLMTLAEPIVRTQLGLSVEPLFTVIAGEALRTTPRHTRLIAGTVVNGVFQLSPYGGSAMLRGLAQSEGFAVVDADVAEGGAVPWLPLPV
jgi:molybdopterin molybdotransferase